MPSHRSAVTRASPWLLRAFVYAVLLSGCVWWSLHVLPAEDAAMLFSYSENLADTGVVSYYPGGPPAEGATDFLWMVLLAGLYKLSLPTYLAAVTAGLLPLIALAEVLAHRVQERTDTVRAAIMGLVLASPFFLAHLVGFSVLAFGSALSLALAGLLFNQPRVLYGAGMIACMVRPDGVAFMGGMIAARAFEVLRGDRWRPAPRVAVATRTEVVRFFGWFCAPLAVYWLARWGYFDSFFPLPFQVKSTPTGAFTFLSLEVLSLIDNGRVLLWCLPLLASIYAWPAHRESRYWVTLTLVSVFVPALIFYSRMDLQHNIGSRLQFPFFLMSAMLFVLFVREWIRLPVAALLALYLLLLASPIPRAYHWHRYQRDRSNVLTLATTLRGMKGVKVMTSEAGLIPYLSKAESYDTWGLNTTAFARRLIQPEDVARLQPDLIYMHSDQDVFPSLSGAEAGFTERTWEHHVSNVLVGARRGGYEMFRVLLTTDPLGDRRSDQVFIRPGSPFADQLRAAVLALQGTRPGAPPLVKPVP